MKPGMGGRAVPEDQKFVALDDQVLLGLTMGITDHGRAMSFFRQLRYLPLVTPTVMAICQDAAHFQGPMADVVIQDIGDSDCVVAQLNDTYQQVIDIHANRIMETGVLPNGAQWRKGRRARFGRGGLFRCGCSFDDEQAAAGRGR